MRFEMRYLAPDACGPQTREQAQCWPLVRLARSALPSVLMATLAACAPQPIVQNNSGSQLVATDRAFAYPGPGGPAVRAVVESRYSNAVEQEIILDTSASNPGQNMLRVQMFGPVGPFQPGVGSLKQEFQPGINVGAEMRRLFPGVGMQRSLEYVQNKYGPFGYAMGRAASGDACFYGWQRITSTGTTQVLVGNKGAIQIRLRLCERAASQAQLLQVMYDYTISSAFASRNWNPYGEPASIDQSFGRIGRPIYPNNVDSSVSQAPAAPVPARVRRQPVSVGVQPPPPSLAVPIGPPVPLPPDAAVPNPANAAPALPSNSTLVPPPPTR